LLLKYFGADLLPATNMCYEVITFLGHLTSTFDVEIYFHI